MLAILKLKNHLNTLTINEKEFEFREKKDQVFEIDKIKTKRKPKLVPSLGEIGSDHGERLVIEDLC